MKKIKRRIQQFFKRLLSSWQKRLNFKINIYQFLGIVCLGFWLVIIFGYFLPVQYNFEGNLLVKSISFTYNGDRDKRLLNEIAGVKNLDIMGSNSQSVVLEGRFSSNSDPNFDRKLKNLKENKLKIEFLDATSRLILKSPTSSLTVLSLPLKPGTKVQQFAYNPDRKELSFCLQSEQELPEACSSPQNLINNQSRQRQQIGSLQLDLGEKPLEISLENVNLPQLKIKTNLNLKYQPTFQEPSLQLSSPTQIYLNLPKNSEPEWLGEDFAVNNVRFSRPKNTGKVAEETEISTILAGEIRMKKEKLELQTEQFLIIEPPKPGIQRLRSLAIKNPDKRDKNTTDSPAGLQIFVSGKSSKLAAGLYPDFPIQEIQFNWLSKFPQEAINAMLAFVGALTAILLPHLLPKAPK